MLEVVLVTEGLDEVIVVQGVVVAEEEETDVKVDVGIGLVGTAIVTV